MFTLEGDAGVHRHIQRRGSGAGVQPDERVCIPRGKRQPQCRPAHGGRPAHTQRMAQLPEVHPRTVRPFELKIRILRAEVSETKLYGCVTWSPRFCHNDTLRQAHHSFLTRCIGWQKKNNRADHPISYLETLIKTESETVEATLRRRRILFAGFVQHMEDTRLLKSVMFRELMGSGGCVVGGQEKEWMGCFLDDMRAFGIINADQSTTAAQDEGKWRRTAEQGAERFMVKWITAEKTRARLRYAIVYPNMTGRTKEKIAQSKRTRAGSLAIVDWPQVARICILRRFVCMSCLSLVFRFFCLVSSSSSCVHLSRGPSFKRSSICMRPGSHTQLPDNCLCYFLCCYFLCFFGDAAFSAYFCTITVPFSLCMENKSYGVFLPCDHGLHFLHELTVMSQFNY